MLTTMEGILSPVSSNMHPCDIPPLILICHSELNKVYSITLICEIYVYVNFYSVFRLMTRG